MRNLVETLIKRQSNRLINKSSISKSDFDEYAKWSSIPIINALTKIEHPCQALEDLLVLTKEDLSLTDDQIKNL